MRATNAASLLLLLALPLMPSASAGLYGDCDGPGGNVALGVVTVGSGRADSATVYVDDRNYLQGDGVWIYLESNHEDALQRGGGSVLNPVYDAVGLSEDNEICSDDTPNGPDTLIF